MLRKLLNGPYAYSPFHRLLEIMALAGFFAVLMYMGRGLTQMAQDLNGYWVWFILLKTMISGYIAADFCSGFVHWIGDTFGEEDWPIVGSGFIKPFREHHVDPKGITRHDFIEVNGNNCFVLLLLIVPVALFVPHSWGYVSFALLSFIMSLSFGTFMTNQFHQWAHQGQPHPLIKRLQRSSMILSPKNHDIHHASPYRDSYCITCGWLNPMLDYMNFWRHSERVVGFFTRRDYSKPAPNTEH